MKSMENRLDLTEKALSAGNNKIELFKSKKDTELYKMKEHMKSMDIRLAHLNEQAFTLKSGLVGFCPASIHFSGQTRIIGGFATPQQARLVSGIARAFLYPWRDDRIESKEADDIIEQAKAAAWDGVCKQYKNT